MTRRLDIRAAAVPACLFALFLQPGCRPSVPVAPPVPPPSAAPRPAFEKTFGDASLDGAGTAIVYKGLVILIDPSASQLAAHATDADFVLLTRAGAAPGVGAFRADQKVIGPDEAAVASARAGAAKFKPLAAGQRLMLSKKSVFAFASAVSGRDANGKAVNGYLLEFDNGRNLLFLSPVADLAPVREFVYNLRDDGKPVYEGFFALRSPSDAAAVAEEAGLIQPTFAVFTGARPDRTTLGNALSAQMFANDWYVANPRDGVPF